MECRFCRAWNSEDEHRCRRCGRRLHPNTARPAPEGYQPVTTTATAPALYHSAVPELVPSAQDTERRRPPRPSYQPPLFKEFPQKLPVADATPLRAHRTTTRHPARKVSPDQQKLEFLESPAPRTLSGDVEGAIYCDSLAAAPLHRVIAATVDISFVFAATGLFLACFHFGGGEFILDKNTSLVLVGVTGLLWFFYQFLFCLAGGDTPGIAWTQLRLVDFDGNRPTREQRLRRLVANCLSIVAAFLGVIWALVDEENLTWHDHMSKTFPTVNLRA